MPAVQRVGDLNAGGGIALGPGHDNVLVNGQPALRPNTPYTPHLGCGKGFNLRHCAGVVGVIGGATSVNANGEPLVVTGDKDFCLHARQGGSPNVRTPGGAGLLGTIVSLAVAAAEAGLSADADVAGTGEDFDLSGGV